MTTYGWPRTTRAPVGSPQTSTTAASFSPTGDAWALTSPTQRLRPTTTPARGSILVRRAAGWLAGLGLLLPGHCVTARFCGHRYPVQQRLQPRMCLAGVVVFHTDWAHSADVPAYPCSTQGHGECKLDGAHKRPPLLHTWQGTPRQWRTRGMGCRCLAQRIRGPCNQAPTRGGDLAKLRPRMQLCVLQACSAQHALHTLWLCTSPAA